jgi:hypothetical protein
MPRACCAAVPSPPQAGRVTASFVVAQRLLQAPEGAWLQRVDAALYAAMLEAVLDQIGWLGILF